MRATIQYWEMRQTSKDIAWNLGLSNWIQDENGWGQLHQNSAVWATTFLYDCCRLPLYPRRLPFCYRIPYNMYSIHRIHQHVHNYLVLFIQVHGALSNTFLCTIKHFTTFAMVFDTQRGNYSFLCFIMDILLRTDIAEWFALTIRSKWQPPGNVKGIESYCSRWI